MESARLDALVLKLRHPLAKIRSRALQSLLFKLRERLVRVSDLEPLQKTLIPSLLASLEPPLELQALHVLQLIVQSRSEVLLTSLQYFGAAQKLQRAANANTELRDTYEKLLRQIYVSNLVPAAQSSSEQASTSEEEEEELPVEEQVTASRELVDRRRAPKVDELEARGWRFAPVTLTSVDEQHLFEFEVKLQLRTEVRDLVVACAAFRDELLRNFPAEVFLQRPAVLQYLLHLVQQPILPGSPGTAMGEADGENVLMERAMEVSMGVNYFDEMMNATFSSKRGNVSGAVCMASLKAIESLLCALQLTRRICLDPAYLVHAPSVHVELFDSYDTRRVLYPRASVELGDDPQRERESAGQLDQYSLSGAVFRIYMSTLPLLRSARHPRLHLLNLLITALPDVREKGCHASAETSVQELDKLRLERIFEVLSGICRPVPSEQANRLFDDDLELTHSMTWKLVELVLRLLRLHPSSRYHVEKAQSASDNPQDNASTDGIVIPRLLWGAVKLWVANPLFSDVAAEWGDNSLVQRLSQIDETIPAFVKLKHSSLQDAKLVLELVGFAKANREKLADFGPWEKPAIINLDVVQKAIQSRSVFDDADSEVIADVTLQAIWSALTTESKPGAETLARNDAETIHAILCDLLSGVDEKKAPAAQESLAARLFCGLMGLVGQASSRMSADRPRQLISAVICEPKFLTLLLLVLARRSEGTVGQELSAALWGILRSALGQLASASGDKLTLLQPVVPLLQHFAYIEPSEGSSQEQRSTQPQLAEVLNRVETTVPDHTRHLLICRCLLHESPYIRKAAASGILRLVSLVAPSSDCVSKEKNVREDPFGGTFVCDGKRLDLETKLMEVPLPASHTSEYQPSENELSSQLTKLSHLHKVISATSSAFENMKEAALKELVTLIENSSVALCTLLEELDKFSDLVDLVHTILQAGPSQRNSSTVLQALLLLRTLLLRSWLLRSAMQRDNAVMELLLPLIFHSSASVRAQMYYILLLLTCSAENFIPNGAPTESLSCANPELSGEARIPEMIKATFGLYSSRWTRCFVTTCSLKQQLQASAALLTQRTDSSWRKEVRSIIKQTSCRSDEDRTRTNNGQFSSLVRAEYALVARKLRDAPSHGKCLNALYHLMTLCEAWKAARERFVGEWEADFERYFAVPPKSERDEIIIGSLVSTLSVVFCAMTRGEQLRALVVVKRKVLPLLKRSQSMAFSLQVARLLLNVSESKVGDLFLSLAADTDIISTICTKYSAMYATEPVLHAMMLEVLLRFASGMTDGADAHLSTPSREKICKRLRDMLSPLLSVVCRHRIPGSFLARDVFVAGSQCMVAILRTLSSDSLLDGDSPLEHTDSSILLDGSWASRFLFDHVSPIRELGFLIVEHTASSSPPSTRLLDMAFETSTDDTEADAVRAAACNVLTKEILQYHERSPDHQAAMVELFHGTTFAGRALRSLSSSLKGDKLAPCTARAFARLVRVLYVQRKSLALSFGDMVKELAAAEEEYEIYPLLVQALSLREWKNKCNRCCSFAMLLPSCPDDAWRRSLLPAILDLMLEVLNLLQAVCRDGGFEQVLFFLLHTTLRYRLMELVRDVHASFDDSFSQHTYQSQYQVLDLCAGTLSILLVQAFDQQGEYNSEQFGAPTTIGFGAEFVAVVASLLESHHPTEFRVSFSRVVPAMSLLMPGSLKSSEATVVNALCSAIYDLYQEISEFRPLDATSMTSSAVAEAQGRVFPLASIRRVACALQVLLETSPLLQHLVRVKRTIPFAMASVKDCFSAIRVAGGFGGRRARSSNASSDTYVLDLCGRIQTNFEVVGAIVGGDKESQRLAKDEGLLSAILPNWNVMKMAHVRGSQLMLQALHLLANYTYGNDTARASLLISLAHGSGKVSGGDASQSLLSLLFNLASSRGDVASSHRQSASPATPSAADMALSNAACQVLKSVLLNTECVVASVKTGSISRLVNSLQDRLKQARQTSKTTALEYDNLAHMLAVLSSVACGDEGAHVLYTSWATVLSLVFTDTMHSTDRAVRRNGCLFLRNLALSQATKTNFALWEDLLDEMVALCVRVGSAARDDLATLGYLSAALWSLVYDNQKARALLLSRPAALRSLQQLLNSHSTGVETQQSVPQASSKEIAGNLRRVLMLVQE